MSIPVWLWVILGFSTLASITSACGYIFRDNVPFKIYVPVVGASFGSVVCLAAFLFWRHDIQFIELSLFCTMMTFTGVGSIMRYRWNHGGKERYERLKAEVLERRRMRIEAKNEESR